MIANVAAFEHEVLVVELARGGGIGTRLVEMAVASLVARLCVENVRS